MFPDEIVTHITSAGLGTFGTDLFVGTGVTVPTGAGPYTVLIPTGGSGPDYIQNEPGAAYRMPGLQITVTASTFAAARTRADALWTLLASVRNQALSSVWYRRIAPLQDPFDGGLDPSSRPRLQFNVVTDKRPS